MSLATLLDASELRRAFDQSFARPASAPDTSLLELIAVRSGDAHYAIRLSDVTALLSNLPLSRLPSTAPAFMGLLVHRGAIVPVFALGTLLRKPAAAARWFVLVRAPELIGLGVDDFEGYLRVPRDSGSAISSEGHVAFVIQDGGVSRGVLELRTILSAITRTKEEG